jgi:hypothetical protein
LITISGTGGSIEGGSKETASAVSAGWTVDVSASIEDGTLPTNCVPNDQVSHPILLPAEVHSSGGALHSPVVCSQPFSS